MNPVIGNRNDDALARQGFADDAIFAFPARLKRAAVKEEDNRRGRLERIGNVKVQPVAGTSAIGNIAMNMIAAARREKIKDHGGRTASTECPKKAVRILRKDIDQFYPRSMISKIP